MFSKVAINNRGAVAARVIRSLRALGVKSVVFCSEADQNLPYVKEADEFVVIGPPAPKDSYLNHDRVLAALAETKATALHPGYGFLAEDALFARKLKKAQVTFIGPKISHLEVFGDKVKSLTEMRGRGLPVNPATGILKGTIEERVQEVEKIGFPVLVKPAGGGGGIGMIPVLTQDKLAAALETAASQALRGFGRDEVYAERLLPNPRHVEFQIIGDGQDCFSLFERDCSIQRRRQKIVEEAGAPFLDRELLTNFGAQAAQVMASFGYNSVGTVETLYAAATGFGFLEVNPRLQVESAVTEEITGFDLVAAQIKLAAGLKLTDLPPAPKTPSGRAIEARVYAEDSRRFLPSPGKLTVYRPPSGSGIRVETGFVEGATVTPFYDPMVAQVIAHGQDRAEAISRLKTALDQFEIEGIKTNLIFLKALLEYPPFLEGRFGVNLSEALLAEPSYQAQWSK
ncbi:MAG: biotin carboxylase [Deltaproteobacteria bacterium]|jgi:acetyl-CoA carboxylase biotin carboxylase subunit|nr:biotin carboxylase [Deltaproteobacteria bacterium]